MAEQDSFRRFLFEDIGVRGELVRLDSSWRAVLERHPYPEGVQHQLGQALAAAVLLSATIKFNGSLILQARSAGPLHTLVAQATHRRTIRGLAQWRDEPPVSAGLADTYGAGHLALTIQNEGAEPYQGIVGLEGRNLADALQNYFSQSEQLATRLWLAADEERAVGLFIQEIPTQEGERQDWERLVMLAETVTQRELLHLPGEQLLYRLFNQERVRLFDPETVSFQCGCSRERIAAVLKALGREEIDDLIRQTGLVEVGCEFCNRRYRFDAVDVEAVFTDVAFPTSASRH
ncbi:MAG: Hsp33 family molecular chaperone HslO [Methylococcaceae bacterium]|nr:Hsp33 family molecular chaperone HslO [Methylococcaceae bacterium]